MKFLDQVKIFLKSGDGGSGCLSFRREKFIPFGGPDGGNGGKGGNIFITAVDNLNTLIDYRYQQHFVAQNGMHGMGENRTGAKGKDITLRVPVGTIIIEDETRDILADLDEVGKSILLLKGGDGGFGNAHFKSANNRAPRRITPGWPGSELWVRLELKLIANAGLIGLPNAGKSSLLSKVTKANPKIANYPFTTLYPNLGVIKIYDQEWVLADLPGLIENAHQGVGLGHRFLSHIERCKMLLHVIDILGENLLENFITINKELRLYNSKLADYAQIIVFNKLDLIDENCRDQIKESIRNNFLAYFKEQKKETPPMLFVSAFLEQGLNIFINEVHHGLLALKPKPQPDISKPWSPI